MNKIFISIKLSIIISLCINLNVYAQNYSLSGIVINAETNEPIQFANIGVEDTYVGTASGIDGKFELEISKVFEDREVRVSAVGFRTKSIDLTELNKESYQEIKLSPVNYGISEVNIEAKSRIVYGLLKTASNMIKDNYLDNAYSYKCYIKSESLFFTNNEAGRMSESIFILSDKQGYTARTFSDAYNARNYYIQENKINKEVNSFKDGLAYIDFAIDQDIVRCPGNILSENALNDFYIELIGTDIINGDSAWVMKYTCNNPTIQNCGDPEAFEYFGEIWINISNQAILKNISTIKRMGDFVHGNSFCSINHEDSTQVEYQVETNYIRMAEKYVLKSIDYQQKNIGDVHYKLKLYLKVMDTIPFDKTIDSRQYFGLSNSRSEFWKNFELKNDQNSTTH